MTIPSYSPTPTPYEEALAGAISEALHGILLGTSALYNSTTNTVKSEFNTHTISNYIKKMIDYGSEGIVGLTTNILTDHDINNQLPLEKPLENIIGEIAQDGSEIPGS
ncbi:hypothetical protein [Candidatus Phycorickettsia trachydisci]|nr:hypothetical protein [Candidatus Phycorickettsia trachydisci]